MQVGFYRVVQRGCVNRKRAEGMDLYDVIVVGAGPAGSRPARLLAEEGFNVLLLEKETLDEADIAELFEHLSPAREAARAGS